MENGNGSAAVSYFDGGVLQWFGWKFLGWLVTAATLGICYPFAVCWLYEWEAKHTVIDGRRLRFTGSAGGLFGTWLLCIVLTAVTLGIYGFYVPLKIMRWREASTFFEDELVAHDSAQKLKFEKASYFDGGFWQLFGWRLLGGLLTLVTLGICYPLAMKMTYSWEQRHKVYCGRRCTFDGTAASLFGTWLLCILLTIITLGIYSLWVVLKIKKWQVRHTHLLADGSSCGSELPAANVMGYLCLIGMALVVIGFFCPMFKRGPFLFHGWDLSDFRFVTISGLLILIGAVLGIVLSFVKVKNNKMMRLVALIVSVVGGVVLVIGFNDNMMYKMIIEDGFIKHAFVGFYVILAGWVVALVGHFTSK